MRGNTNVKLAIFKKSEIIHLETVVVDLFVEAVKRIFKEFPKIEFSIISSVGSISKDPD